MTLQGSALVWRAFGRTFGSNADSSFMGKISGVRMAYPWRALWTYLHFSLRTVKISGGKKKREQERGALDRQKRFSSI